MKIAANRNTDDYNYEYFLQEDVCRLCWNKNAHTEIINCNIEESGLDNQLTVKISDCLGIDVSARDPKYPNKICSECFELIDQFYNFRSFCRKNNVQLCEIFKAVVNINQTDTTNFKFDSSEVLEDKLCLIKCDENESVLSKYEPADFLNTNQQSDTGSDSQPLSQHIKRKKKVKVKLRKLKKLSSTYCNICKIDLEDIEKLTIHNTQIHDIVEGWYTCYGCDKKFKSLKRRQAHERTFCKGLKEGYKCLECHQNLLSRKSYEIHTRGHKENVSIVPPKDLFMCEKCHRTFTTKESLLKHDVVHSGHKKRFICESCGRVFTRHDYLHKHKLIHTGTKQYACPHCSLRFTQRSSLTVHIRKHTGERPYSCDMCPQRCISSSNLRAHRRRHLGDKKYECLICNRKYGYKISLEEHIASTHAQSQSYICQYCGAIYTRPRGLRRHLLAKHKDKQEKAIDNVKQKDYTEIVEVINVEGKSVATEYQVLEIKNQDVSGFVVQ